MKTRLHIAHKAMTLLTLLLVSSMVKASDIAPGYYYMKGTEASTANGYYLRATSSDLPRMITHQMPETPTLDEKPFIWKVESMDGGFYSIQSIYDHRLDHTLTTAVCLILPTPSSSPSLRHTTG